MERRAFIKSSCLSCLAASVSSFAIASCSTTRYVNGAIETDGVRIDASDFIEKRKEKVVAHKFIIIQNEKLAFPIYIYKISEQEYSALWMQCSHQGNELQALGDQLHCPAHGSEFDIKGKVTQGPASHNLRSFPVSVNDNSIFIDLRAT